jgi:hypothetical protein
MAMMDILKKAAARFGRKSPEMQSARLTTLAHQAHAHPGRRGPG